MLPKVNEADMAEAMETTKECPRSCSGVMRASIAHVNRKIIIVQAYGDYPRYVTPDNKMITRNEIFASKQRGHFSQGALPFTPGS